MYNENGQKNGRKKSDQTVKWCEQIIEELKTGNKSSYELEQKFGIKEPLFPAVLTQLTYMANVYEYKVNNKLWLGLLNRGEK